MTKGGGGSAGDAAEAAEAAEAAGGAIGSGGGFVVAGAPADGLSGSGAGRASGGFLLGSWQATISHAVPNATRNWRNQTLFRFIA